MKRDNSMQKKFGVLMFVGIFILGNMGLLPVFADKLAVPLGKSINLKLTGVKKIMAVKENVVEVLNVSDDEVILAGVGASPDATQLIVWDATGRQIFDVETYSESQIIQQKFSYLFGEASVNIQLFPDSVYLRGIVDLPEKVKKAEDILVKLVNGLPIVNLLEVRRGVGLKQRIEEAIAIPTVNVTVINPEDTGASDTSNIATSTTTTPVRVVLEGYVKNQNDYMRMVEVVKGFVRDSANLSNLVKLEDPLQVIFQTYVLHVKKGKDKELGINWGSAEAQGENILAADLGKLNFFENPSLAYRGGDARVLGAPLDTWPNPLKFNSLNRFDIIGAIVKAWETKSLAKVLSNPKLIVFANSAVGIRNKMGGSGWTDEGTGGEGAPGEGLAYVKVTRRIPYLGPPDNNGVRPPNFTEAQLALSIRDLYVDGEKLKFSVFAQQDDLVSAGDAQLPPQVDRRTLTTTVRIKDEETVVLGGLINKTTTKVDTSVPGLSRLPWVGRLFKNSHNVVDEAELVILLTPKIQNRDTNLAGDKKFEVVPVPRRTERLEELHNLFQDIKKSHFPESKKD